MIYRIVLSLLVLAITALAVVLGSDESTGPTPSVAPAATNPTNFNL